MIWETLFSLKDNYKDKVIDTINKYKPDYRERNPEILDFDLTLLVPFIQSEFSSNSFKETHLVNRLITSLSKEEKIENKTYLKLKPIFDTQEYRDYKKLGWNRIRDKEEYEFDDWREYEKVKSDDLKTYFTFSLKEEFDVFLKTISHSQSVQESAYSQIGNSLEVVFSENFLQNNNLGLSFLETYLKKDFDIRPLHRTISTIVNHSKSCALKLWELLCAWDNENCIYWKLNFLDRLPNDYINDQYYDRLIKTIKGINAHAYLYLDQYAKFSTESRNAIKEVLSIIHKKIKDESLKIRLSEYPFKESLEVFENDYTLMKEVYFLQFKLAKSAASFDYKMEGFANIYKSHKTFLFDFFKHFYSEFSAHRNDKHLDISFIWDYPERVDEIEKVIDLLIDKDIYISLGGHSVSMLFNKLEGKKIDIAFIFLKNIIHKNHTNRTHIEVVFDTIRTNMQIKHDELFLYFLSLNKDVEFFKTIDWVGNPGIQSGNVIWGELHAKRWGKVLNIINLSDDQLSFIPIKNFLKKRIQAEYNRAETERMQYFIRPDR